MIHHPKARACTHHIASRPANDGTRSPHRQKQKGDVFHELQVFQFPSGIHRRHVHIRAALGLLYLGLVISVGAQLLLYRLICSGNLVNVTSLFYLVPMVTVILDFLILGNAMPALAIAGMAAILAGLVLVFQILPHNGKSGAE